MLINRAATFGFLVAQLAPYRPARRSVDAWSPLEERQLDAVVAHERAHLAGHRPHNSPPFVGAQASFGELI